MRKIFATALAGGVMVATSLASPAAAAPNPEGPACHERPGGTMHGTLHAHATVPHGNPAHGHIPHHCH